MLVFYIIHMIGVHPSLETYLYTYVNDYIWIYIFLRIHIFTLNFNHRNCTCIAWFQNKKPCILRGGGRRVRCKRTWFLVFDERCTPWDHVFHDGEWVCIDAIAKIHLLLSFLVYFIYDFVCHDTCSGIHNLSYSIMYHITSYVVATQRLQDN